LIIEFRSRDWAQPATFEFLKANKLGYCIVEEPKLNNLMPFINQATSDVGYLRFHGRNKNWFNAPVEERYNYDYSDDELKGFIPDIIKLFQQAHKTFLFFNNCHAGFAARNALRLRELLKKQSDLF